MKRIDELRAEKFALKKALLFERKKNKDLEEKFLELKRMMSQREEEIREQNGEVGDLVIQKNSLESTLKSLSEEVELLSQKNEKLLEYLN